MSRWRDTLDELVRLRGRALFGYAYVLTGDRTTAEDLVQDALVRAFRSGRHARDIDAAHAYVKRAVATAFIDAGRRAAARPAVDLGVPEAVQDAAAAAVPDHSERVTDTLDLHRALLLLSPRERACVVLRYLEDMSTDQAARVLGLAPGSVKRYTSDGIKRLSAAVPGMAFDDTETAPVAATRRTKP